MKYNKISLKIKVSCLLNKLVILVDLIFKTSKSFKQLNKLYYNKMKKLLTKNKEKRGRI